ncbi:hypothetical protein GCM10028798_34600 [Humibacter antri]
MSPTAMVLTLVSGVAWTVVYIDAIRIGFRFRTYAMPVAALSLNLAWELSNAVASVVDGVPEQGVVGMVWGGLDIVIAVTFFRYGRAELPSFVTRPLFIGWGVLIFAVGFACQWLFFAKFGLGLGGGYTAFLQNVLMSGLFIAMFASRRGARGQSLTIAVAKWVGTLAPTVQYALSTGHGFVVGLGIVCGVLDLTYIALLLWARRKPQLFEQQHAPDRALRRG